MGLSVGELAFAPLFVLFFMLLHGAQRLYLKIKGRRYDRRKAEP